jgi:hypothetical protein
MAASSSQLNDFIKSRPNSPERISDIIFKWSSQSDPSLQSFISTTLTRPYSAPPSDNDQRHFHSMVLLPESLVVLIHLKSILIGPPRLRNSETLIDQSRPMLWDFNYSTYWSNAPYSTSVRNNPIPNHIPC